MRSLTGNITNITRQSSLRFLLSGSFLNFSNELWTCSQIFFTISESSLSWLPLSSSTSAPCPSFLIMSSNICPEDASSATLRVLPLGQNILCPVLAYAKNKFRQTVLSLLEFGSLLVGLPPPTLPQKKLLKAPLLLTTEYCTEGSTNLSQASCSPFFSRHVWSFPFHLQLHPYEATL